MKNKFTAVIGLAAMLLLLAAVACASSAPPLAPTQPSVSVRPTAVPTNLPDERAFRNLKTVQLEVRPVYHKNDDRIRSHVFLCMLAYYLQWHMEQRLAPLFEGNGVDKERRWTFRGVIDCLAQITRNKVAVNGAEFYQNSTPTQAQAQILDLLGVKM